MRSRKRISLSPNTRTRPLRRYSSKPATASPVFWMYGSVMRRSRPAAPASTSSSRPLAAPRAPTRAPTLTPPVTALSSRPPAPCRCCRLGRGGPRRPGHRQPVLAARLPFVGQLLGLVLDLDERRRDRAAHRGVAADAV